MATTEANASMPSSALANSASQLPLDFSDVVIVLASDQVFAPYMAVAIQSIVEHTDPERHYDIVVLTRDIDEPTRRTLVAHVATTAGTNVSLGFLNAEVALKGAQLPHHGHFRPETFFRLLAPWLLPTVRKAIYLDSDLVVLDDPSKLFDTDVTGYLLAATHDADMQGQICGYDGTVKSYMEKDLELSDPMGYFQAGVLLLNLEAFRQIFSIQDMLELSTRKVWRWLDQDILNMLANGQYVEVPMRWNTLMDWKGIRRKRIIGCAPEATRQAYEEARRNPAVVHYAGPDDRPWLYPDCDMSDYFWDYASRSAFEDQVRARLEEWQTSLGGRAKKAEVDAIYKYVFRFFDFSCPPGSARRTRVIKTYVALGGDIA